MEGGEAEGPRARLRRALPEWSIAREVRTALLTSALRSHQTPRPAPAGVSHGELWHADPTIFKIFNDKLYIFCCPAAKAHFDNSTEPSIAAATKTWNAWTKTPVDFANKARSLSRRSPHDRVRAVRAVP